MEEATEEVGRYPSALLEVPAFLMLQILRHGRHAAEALPGGPRLPRFAVLAALAEFGPLSQREIAYRTGLDPSDVVAILDRLEADGHAERRRDPDDRRRNAVAATPEGEHWLGERIEGAATRTSLLLAGLEEEERAQLVALLRRVLDDLSRRAGPL
jgi:DNA-binding MarR family transcriptional regulator